jgi:hypothetical protein
MATSKAEHLAECAEDLLKFLRKSLSAGPMSNNPRTETYHLQRLRMAVEEYRAEQSTPETRSERDKSKCTCVYATAENTPSVASQHELGGYVKEMCAYCTEQG